MSEDGAIGTTDGAEQRRLAALARYAILDTPAEQRFDDIVALAAAICAAPVALVSLVDSERQWFKARVGLEAAETDLSRSICAHGLAGDGLLVIPDLLADPRTAANPLVTGPPHARFYAGAPLRTPDGETLGMLCVLDHAPRAHGLDTAQGAMLAALARQVVANLELHRHVALLDRQLARRRDAERRLAESQARWRTLFAGMSEGVVVGEVVRDAAGAIADWRFRDVNAAAARLLGAPAGELTGRTQREVRPAGIEQGLRLAAVVDAGGTADFAHGGGPGEPSYEGSAFAIGQNRFAAVFRDVTEAGAEARRQAALLAVGDRLRECTTISEMTHAAARIAGEALHASRSGYGTIDPETETVDIEPDWTDGVASIAGRHRFEDFGRIRDELARGEPLVIDDVRTDPRTAADPRAMLDVDIGALVNMPVRERGRTVAVFIVQSRGPRRWTAADLDFTRNVADRLEAGVARLRAEAQQQLLNQELSHRLKNALAMVQAIASQTLKSADPAALEGFQARLQALGAAHDVLLQRSWAATSLGEVIGRVLDAFGQAARTTIAGPPVPLGPRATLATSLAMHELGTNAVKYGAWSAPGGRVAVDWSIDAEGLLRLAWREAGGPPVREPARRGFGSKLLGLGLLGIGGTELRYAADGLVATMAASAAELAVS